MPSLLKPAVNQQAFLKCGIYGQEGSGKTYTASLLAIGISTKNKRPRVAFFDTETGSDFLLQLYKKSDIQLDVVKSRAFVDLCSVVKEAQGGSYGCLVIDSISHVWRDLSVSYQEKKGKKFLTIQDWMNLKLQWQVFSDLFVNSKLNIVACGRRGFEFDNAVDEDGKLEIRKTGTKMKAEGEFAYESSLLIEMERLNKSEVTGHSKDRGIINRAYILKDRTNTINGQSFDFPEFKHFLPHVEALNLGGEHVGFDESRNSQEMFESRDTDFAFEKKQREVMLEELAVTLAKWGLDGTAGDVKKQRIALLERHFGTANRVKLESMDSDKLFTGLNNLRVEREGSDGQ